MAQTFVVSTNDFNGDVEVTADVMTISDTGDLLAFRGDVLIAGFRQWQQFSRKVMIVNG